jgi:hypothetical protein
MCPSPGGFAVGRVNDVKATQHGTAGHRLPTRGRSGNRFGRSTWKAIAPKGTSRLPQRTLSRYRDPPSQSGIITDKLSIDLGANGRPLGERDDRTRSGPVVYLSLAQNEGDIGARSDRFVLQAEHIRGQQLQ